MLSRLPRASSPWSAPAIRRSEEHTSELQSRQYIVCRLLLEKTTNAFPSRHNQTVDFALSSSTSPRPSSPCRLQPHRSTLRAPVPSHYRPHSSFLLSPTRLDL